MEADLRHGDCLPGMRELPPASVDLVFTSPPYADLRGYLRIRPDDYVAWFLPFAREIHRVLKPDGSFILNIGDRVVAGWRHPYVFALVAAILRDTGLGLVERMIWRKTTAVPTGARRRPVDNLEWLLWFAPTDRYRFHLDAVRRPYSPRTLKRYQTLYNPNRGGHIARTKRMSPHPLGALPLTVLDFPLPRAYYGHPATMREEIPAWFIRACTAPGDLVCDPFLGSGTTAVAAVRLGRRALGWDIHAEFVDIARRRVAAVVRSRVAAEQPGQESAPTDPSLRCMRPTGRLPT